jgi:hypothetical protein
MLDHKLKMIKTKPKSGCLICGAELIYLKDKVLLECAICHATKWADAYCQDGHFLCDSCHADDPDTWIEQQCLISNATDPLQLAVQLMRHPCVAMHGPEHHFLVPAVLLTVYFNLKHDRHKKKKKLQEARRRAQTIVGGSCGFHGACGAAIGVGIFMSLVLEATPLSIEEYRLCNSATAEALARIASRGGPRCCKRNVFLALEFASECSASYLGQPVPIGSVSCDFFPNNRECLGTGCVFFDKQKDIHQRHSP